MLIGTSQNYRRRPTMSCSKPSKRQGKRDSGQIETSKRRISPSLHSGPQNSQCPTGLGCQPSCRIQRHLAGIGYWKSLPTEAALCSLRSQSAHFTPPNLPCAGSTCAFKRRLRRPCSSAGTVPAFAEDMPNADVNPELECIMARPPHRLKVAKLCVHVSSTSWARLQCKVQRCTVLEIEEKWRREQTTAHPTMDGSPTCQESGAVPTIRK